MLLTLENLRNGAGNTTAVALELEECGGGVEGNLNGKNAPNAEVNTSAGHDYDTIRRTRVASRRSIAHAVLRGEEYSARLRETGLETKGRRRMGAKRNVWEKGESTGEKGGGMPESVGFLIQSLPFCTSACDFLCGYTCPRKPLSAGLLPPAC